MNQNENKGAEYDFYAKLPLKKAIPLGMQHVLAMFVGNLTALLIITGTCGLAGGEFADLQLSLLRMQCCLPALLHLCSLYSADPELCRRHLLRSF